MPRPTFFLLVRQLMIQPIPARPGEILAVQPGHPTHTLAVLDRTASVVLRHRYVEDGAIYGITLMLDPDASDGQASWLTERDRVLAQFVA
jgi:hypothetical protein